jgi:hypothetical protein
LHLKFLLKPEVILKLYLWQSHCRMKWSQVLVETCCDRSVRLHILPTKGSATPSTRKLQYSCYTYQKNQVPKELDFSSWVLAALLRFNPWRLNCNAKDTVHCTG